MTSPRPPSWWIPSSSTWLRGESGGSDFAVMYRTNAQSRLMEEALIRARLPYRLVGAQRFYGRREVKDMIAFLRLMENPADEVSLLRVIGVPPRGIGDKTILALQSAAFQAGISAGEVLLDLGQQGRGFPLLVHHGTFCLPCWRISARCSQTGTRSKTRSRLSPCSTASSATPATNPTSTTSRRKATTAGTMCRSCAAWPTITRKRA